MQYVRERVTLDINDALEKLSTPEEVRATFFHMAAAKAPGVDGFTAGDFSDIGISLKMIWFQRFCISCMEESCQWVSLTLRSR